jgi:high-affinity Fe2+/Pb2+ permease
MPNLFSVPIFFIVFRETLEAAIIISVLLGLAEQIVQEAAAGSGLATQSTTVDEGTAKGDPTSPANESDAEEKRRLLIRKLRIQVSASVLPRGSLVLKDARSSLVRRRDFFLRWVSVQRKCNIDA